jgi:oligopeptidase A
MSTVDHANPLLQLQGLPRFSAIRPEHVEPALDELLADNRERLKVLEAMEDSADWGNFVQPMEDVNERLTRMWSPVSHLNSVKDSEELRQVYEACLPKLSAYHTEVGQNEAFYRAFKHIADGPGFLGLETAQRKVVTNELSDFRILGVDLPPEKKKRFKEIQQQLSKLSNQFERNVLDATQAWSLHIKDKKDLSGLPDSLIAMARQMAEREQLQGWKFSLDIPSYLPFMMHADDRSLRQRMYEAYVTRASDQGPNAGRHDNTDLIGQLLNLRQESAQLLGFNNYAQLSLETKMAETPVQVLDFLRDLARRSRAVARKELEDVKRFAREQYGWEDFQAWDLAYYSEKLRQSLYRFTDEDIRPYFPATRVLHGLFDVVGRLYGLTISEISDVDVWDRDVRFFEISDVDGDVRGRFYVDLYVRPHKRGGAWMDECVSRKRDAHGTQIPVAYLTCNFSPPVGDKPALLTHDEVVTLFHEFGHGLHHMLTKVDYVGVAGINGVAWDAVELPSQFMENWCWEREALDIIGGHYQLGVPLPDELLEKMRSAKNFQSGMQMLRQIEFALFDLLLYYDFNTNEQQPVQGLLDEVRREVAVVIPPAYNRFQNSFTHIFSGGYAAGYYSYKWAEVLSADAFSRFEEEGILNPHTGRAFMKSILEQGGSREPMDLFLAFRGRKPTINALLRHNGLSA